MKNEIVYFKQTNDAQVFGKCSSAGLNDTAEERPILSKYQREPSPEMSEEIGCLGDVNFNIVSHSFLSSDEEIKDAIVDIKSETTHGVGSKKGKVHVFPSASLQLLTDYGKRFKRLNGERRMIPSYETECKKLSTDAIIRLAAERFVRCKALSGDKQSGLYHSHCNTFSGLCEKDNRDVELVLYLLASVEKVGAKQFDCARKLLQECDKLIHCKANPVQRLVNCFSEALHEKINRETGKTTLNLRKMDFSDVEQEMMTPTPTILAFHKAVPFCHVTQQAGIQAIIEHVVEARKIRIIDLAISNGIKLTVLMQALATRSECPVEFLKITAVGTKSKMKIEETGRRLTSFAQSLNLPFSFDIVMMEDILDLKESLLSLDDDEVVAVCSGFFFKTLIGQPDRLESLMRVIKNISPQVMVVAEIEANINSPVFLNRFIEAFFFHAAFFNCLEECLKHDESSRRIQELFDCRKGILNIVAAEGEERTIRNVRIGVWRAFFARFGMVDVEFSMSSKYQANLVLERNFCSSSYTLDVDGNSLILGWKGTPLISLSVWKFK